MTSDRNDQLEGMPKSRRRSCANKRRLSWVACKAAQRPKTTAVLAVAATATLWQIPAIKIPAMVAMHVFETDMVNAKDARAIANKVLNALPRPSGFTDGISTLYNKSVRAEFPAYSGDKKEYTASDIRGTIWRVYRSVPRLD